MKVLVRLFFTALFVLFYQCDAPKKAKNSDKEIIETKKNIKKDTVLKKVVKKWNTIDSKNTDAFLLEYGKENPETKVIIKTEFGNIKLRLFTDVPAHRASFIYLVKNKYFNTTVFYRVAKNFVVQGGNSDNYYTIKERRKHGNYLIKPEFKKHRTHKFGALAAAREWDNNPNKLSNPFEFYMVHKKNGAHHLDNEHTVFGKVIAGFDTMDKISEVKVGPGDWPVKDIPMVVEILD